MSSVRNLNFCIGAWFCCIHSFNHAFHILSKDRPTRITENHNRNRALRKILLVADVLVGGQEYFKRGFFRGS